MLPLPAKSTVEAAVNVIEIPAAVMANKATRIPLIIKIHESMGWYYYYVMVFARVAISVGLELFHLRMPLFTVRASVNADKMLASTP